MNSSFIRYFRWDELFPAALHLIAGILLCFVRSGRTAYAVSLAVMLLLAGALTVLGELIGKNRDSQNLLGGVGEFSVGLWLLIAVLAVQTFGSYVRPLMMAVGVILILRSVPEIFVPLYRRERGKDALCRIVTYSLFALAGIGLFALFFTSVAWYTVLRPYAVTLMFAYAFLGLVACLYKGFFRSEEELRFRKTRKDPEE